MSEQEQVPSDEHTKCPKCLNEYGFAFGTCSDCGWNYLDSTWHFITMWRPDPIEDSELIAAHEKSVARRYQMRAPK